MEKEINIDIERLLRSKSWSQLNTDDMRQVKDYLNTEQEYEAMRALVLELRSAVQTDEALKPASEIRDNLLAAFDAEQSKRRALWWNGLLISLKDKLRFDIPAIRYGVSGAFVVLLLFVAFRFFTNGDAHPNVIVKNETAPVVNPAQNNDSVANEMQVAVNTDSSSIENTAALIQEQELRMPVTQQPQSNTLATTVDQSPMVDSAAAVANVMIDSSNIATLAVWPANALLSSGSATVLTNSATAPMNYTWSNTTFTDAGSSIVVGTAVYSVGPEKTRPLSSDAGLVHTYYSLR